MLKRLSYSLVLLIASLITFGFSYIKIPITTYQEAVVLLLIVVLGFFNFLNNKKQTAQVTFYINLFILFIASLLVQLLISSSGGVFSPFLILFHLFSLGTAFLISTYASFNFLFMALLVLGVTTYLDPNQLNLVEQDPGTLALYLVSFVVILPLNYLIANKYHLKEEVSNMLSKELEVGQGVLESLNEMVLITDENLKISSVNDSFYKQMQLPEKEVLGKLLFDVLDLRDLTGTQIGRHELSIDQIIEEKSSRIVSNLFLYSKSRSIPFRVSIQIRPNFDNNKIEKFTFVISQVSETNAAQTFDLEKATKLQKMRFDSLKKELHEAGLSQLAFKEELLRKGEEDLLILQQIQNGISNDKNHFVDLFDLITELVKERQVIGSNLGVNIEFAPDSTDSKESAILNLKKNATPSTIIPLSDYSININQPALRILLNKLLDLCQLLAFRQPSPKVEIKLQKAKEDLLLLTMTASAKPLPIPNQSDLFIQYYGDLASSTNLSLGSGSEGYIIKQIATELNIPIEVTSGNNVNKVTFHLKFPRNS